MPVPVTGIIGNGEVTGHRMGGDHGGKALRGMEMSAGFIMPAAMTRIIGNGEVTGHRMGGDHGGKALQVSESRQGLYCRR